MVGAPASADAFVENWGTLRGDVEAKGKINNYGSITGTLSEGVPLKQMPDPSTVFNYYIRNGTLIDVNALAGCIDGFACISEVVLSPASNPYGTQTNPMGIYVIKCGGKDIMIEKCRIVGTIVLLSAGSNSVVDNETNWEPFVRNYPALLFQGSSLTLDFDTAPLDEAKLGTNFNPAGTPFQGVEDGDQMDTYPAVIKGLVYGFGRVIAGDLTVDGVIVSGGHFQTDDSGATTTTIKHNSRSFRNPPPGFSAGDKMVPAKGNWRRSELLRP